MLAAADRAHYVTTKEELADRYGRGPRPIRRRVFWVTVATAAILSVAGLSWLTVSNSLDDVGFDETGYELGNRPAWVGIPLAGILELLTQENA